MARMVATKAALSIRLDALADADSKSSLDSATIGIDNRVKLEARLRQRESFLPLFAARVFGSRHLVAVPVLVRTAESPMC